MAAVVEVRHHSLANKIKSEILRAKEDLQGVDDNLRRLTGRDFNGVGRSESHRFSASDGSGPRNTQPPAKRQSLGGIGVFARLGDVVERNPDVGSRMNGSTTRGRSGVLRRDSRDGLPQRGDMEGYSSDHEGGRPPGGDRRRGGGRGDHGSFRSPPRRDGGMAFAGRGGRRAMEEDGGFRGGRGAGVGSRVYGGGGRRGDAKYVAMQEEELEGSQLSSPKPAVASSVARATVDTSRVEAAAVATSDRASRDRNRRMFGALLGTLQSFKKDEAKQRDKEEQRLAVEKKLEQKGIEEQEQLRQEKRRLWEERRTKQMHIRRLAEHAERVKEHEQWAEQQLRLTHFIRTKASPPVFWLPRTLTRAADKLKLATAEDIQCEVSKRREQLEEELQQLLRKTERSGKEQPDYLDFGGDEGDDLDYDGGDAGGELVWPSGRGKVGMDGETRDSSRDARHSRELSKDVRNRDVSVGKVRRGREGKTTPEVSAGVSDRRCDSDDADLTSTGKDVLLSGRMVVQVGGTSGGERSVGGVRRVVEVIEEEACKKHKGGDAGAARSARLKLLVADMRDITIKVERGVDGSEEKENRKIIVEKTSDKADKGKDKNKRKGKSDKIKDVDNAENDLEDEVTRMRKRIVEKARKMENEEKEKNLKKIGGDIKGIRKNAESEFTEKSKENAKSPLGLSKTENKKPKEDSGSVNVKAANDKPTAEELEAIKDITEGVASCEEFCEEDEVEGNNKDLTNERNEADSSVNADAVQAEVATAPPVVTDTRVCSPAVSAAADETASMKQNMSMQEQQEEDEKKDSGEAVLTMELPSFENFDDDGASQGELAGDALQLTVDPMEKAMMEADVEGLDGLEPESKSSRSREKHISGSVSSSRSTSKTSRSSIKTSGVDYKNGKYVKSKDVNKTSVNKHDRNSKEDAKSKFDKDYSKPGFSSDASQSKVIKPTGASSSSGKFGVKVAKLDESLSKTVANVCESDVSSVMRVDASSVSKNGQSGAKSEDAGKKKDSPKMKEKQRQPSDEAKKSLSNDNKHDKVSRPDDKVTESEKDKKVRKKTEPLGAVGPKLPDGKLPKSDTRKTETQQKVVVLTAVKDVTEATSVEKSSKHEKSSKKSNVGGTSKSSEEVKLTSKSGDTIRREENRANISLKSTEVYKKVDERRREPEIKKKTQSDQRAADLKETRKVLLKSKSVSKSESSKDKLTKESEKVYRETTDKRKDDIKTSEKKKLYKSEVGSEIRSKKIDRDNQDHIDDFEHATVTSGDKRSTDTRKRKLPSEDTDEEESRSYKKKTRHESPMKRHEGLKKSNTNKIRQTDNAKHRRHDDSESSSDDSDDSSSSDDSDDDSGSSQSGDDSSSSDDSSDSSSNSSSDSASGSESEDQNTRQKQIKRSNVSSSSSKNHSIRDKRHSASDSDLDDNEDEEEEDNRMRNPPTKKGGSSKSADAGEKNSRGKLVVKTKTIKKNMVEDERDSRRERESEKSRDGRTKETTTKRRRSRSRDDRSRESRKVRKK